MSNLFANGYESERDSTGKFLYQRDTDYSWGEFTKIMSRRVEREASGHAPPKGDWNYHWTFIFRNINLSQENPEKYINFVINLRRSRGLPELQIDRSIQ